MSGIDFRKAYAAEVKASAESKARCNEAIEWAEQQRLVAISSHAGQLRNTIAFKADVEVLKKALESIIEMNRQHAKDQYGDADKAESWACITVARRALSAVGEARD